jgi:hypothetical protein
MDIRLSAHLCKEGGFVKGKGNERTDVKSRRENGRRKIKRKK